MPSIKHAICHGSPPTISSCQAVSQLNRAMTRWAALTGYGQRRDKVAAMRWDDIDANGVWTVSVEDEEREKGHIGMVRLPKLALDILDRQDRIEGNPYVFPARGRGPFNSFSQRKRELDAKLPKMENWTLHDLRRTARTLLSEIKVLPHISECVLGHSLRTSSVEGVYDQYSYTEEKSQALEQLAAHIASILHPPTPTDNVVPLERQRRA